ncbi:uncharacterized protein LACBIDRAFT_332866 [Laccaria bicolor S238N-H82]|uniref:Predicted protein n=1 Tax=Laccaria bicolor (strain S238N-H82 / ATCC MYA-4686) TaxID=486041 RepID=B0DU41_LACBS|nr:uncharacterized protein LACBIDRAFT_332866 [Laccaria bicolor S238N-H82]EDR01837.1 predicted protein [Laccaria bicolor S238N-H82]|eukprot:XP_001887447.1 predicted protein [Laccaria bicolor S238N-H82]
MPKILFSVTICQPPPTMVRASLDAATLLEELERSSTLSFVCEPPQESSSSLDGTRPSSQIHSSPSTHASGDIYVSGPFYSSQYLPGIPNAFFVRLRIEDDYTGVPKVLHNKTLLWFSDGMYWEVVSSHGNGCYGISLPPASKAPDATELSHEMTVTYTLHRNWETLPGQAQLWNTTTANRRNNGVAKHAASSQTSCSWALAVISGPAGSPSFSRSTGHRARHSGLAKPLCAYGAPPHRPLPDAVQMRPSHNPLSNHIVPAASDPLTCGFLGCQSPLAMPGTPVCLYFVQSPHAALSRCRNSYPPQGSLLTSGSG